MTLTVLFDLDDTLLDTNMEEFFPAYFDRLGQAFSSLVEPSRLIRQIEIAVQQMNANRDPGRLLADIFSDYFYPALGLDEEKCKGIIETFYRQEFPKLRGVTRQKPEAKDLIDWCKAQNMTLAIATNPLFPEPATQQRIEWAELDPDDFVFFSTYNNFHFTKPNPSYYAECLGRLGWPEQPAVMVGDNLSHDLLPVQKFGYPTFWVNPENEGPNQPQGTLAEVQPWLEALMADYHDHLNTNFEVSREIMRATPAVLDSWLRINPEATLRDKPSLAEWSPVEIFWHLAEIENKVHLPQWQSLLSDHNVPLIAPDTSQWADDLDYQSRDPLEAQTLFLESRKSSIAYIDELSMRGLSGSSVQHTVFGPMKIEELIAFSVKHDRIHLRQCSQLLAHL